MTGSIASEDQPHASLEESCSAAEQCQRDSHTRSDFSTAPPPASAQEMPQKGQTPPHSLGDVAAPGPPCAPSVKALGPFSRLKESLAIFVLFAILSIAWLWPMPRSLASGVAAAPYWWDSGLTAYLMGEMRDSLSRLFEHPLALFELRILHPQRDAGTLSENLLAPALLTLPLKSLLSAIALQNLLVIVGFATTGAAMFAYLRRRVRRRTSALVGAILFTYAPVKLMLLARIQYTSTQFIPILFLFLELFLLSPTARPAAALAWSWLAQLATCIYLALNFLILAIPVSFVFIPRCWKALRRRHLLWLIPSTVPAAVLALAMTIPYAKAASNFDLSRDAKTVAAYSGRWADLLTPSDLSLIWGHRAKPVDQGSGREPVCFPGALLLVLGGVGALSFLWTRKRCSPSQALFGYGTHLGILALSTALFLGTGPDAPRAPFSPFGWIQSMPGLHGMRYSSRFALHITFALAVFSSWAVDDMLTLIGKSGRTQGRLASVALVLSSIIDTWTKPLPIVSYPNAEAIYAALGSDHEARAILELPFDNNLHEPRIVRNLAVLTHHLPTLGGYTGFDPTIWHYVRDQLAGFPNETSRALLAETGVNRVVVHRHELTSLSVARLTNTPWLTSAASDPQHTLYTVEGVPRDRAIWIRTAADDFPRALPANYVSRDKMRITVADPTMNADLDAMLDGNPETRWTTMHPRRSEPWFTIELDEPTRVSALWFDTRKSPLDGPSAVMVRGLLDDGTWVTLLAERAHECVRRLATAPASSYDVHRFPPTTVKALSVTHMGESPFYWGSIYELFIERP